jgi:hypothetical protein
MSLESKRAPDSLLFSLFFHHRILIMMEADLWLMSSE